jgi:hypothetical protein
MKNKLKYDGDKTERKACLSVSELLVVIGNNKKSN